MAFPSNGHAEDEAVNQGFLIRGNPDIWGFRELPSSCEWGPIAAYGEGGSPITVEARKLTLAEESPEMVTRGNQAQA